MPSIGLKPSGGSGPAAGIKNLMASIFTFDLISGPTMGTTSRATIGQVSERDVQVNEYIKKVENRSDDPEEELRT
jgi:hypothetical protein